MNNQKLGEHEKMELHELLTFKTVCTAKASAMKEMCNDQQLKSLFEQDMNKSKQCVQELQSLLSGSTGNMGTLQ